MAATEGGLEEDNEALFDSRPDSNLTIVDDSKKEEFSIDNAVESIGFGAFHFLMVLFCGLGWMVAGNYDIQISVLSVILKCEWGLSVSQEALITSVYFIGLLFATQFWGYVADRYGRRRALYLGNTLLAVFGSLTALAPYYGWILVLRALTAFASGVAIVQVTYLTEIIPRKARGIAVQSLEIFYVLGGILIIGVGMAMVPSVGWRWYLATSAILTVPLMIVSFTIPETPRYLTLKGQTHKAQSILVKIAKFNCKPSLSAKLESAGKKDDHFQLSMIVSDGEQDDSEELNGEMDKESSRAMLPVIVTAHQEIKHTNFLFAHLFKKGMWRTTVLLWLIWLTSTAYYFGTFLLATSLFRFREHCNTGGIPKLDVCQSLQPEDYIDIMWTTSAELPGVIVFALLSPFLGRRVLMAGGVTLCAIFTGLLYLCQHREVTTAFLFCARAFISGASQILYVYTAEVYPTEVRSLGLGIASAVGSAGGIITPYIAQVLLEANDVAGISLFLAMVVACTVAIVLLPIETKGKSLRETGNMQLKERVCCRVTPAACNWHKNTFFSLPIFV